METKRILITGGTGYIGSNLSNYISKLGYPKYEVTIFTGNNWHKYALPKSANLINYNELSTFEQLSKFIYELKPDTIVHCATHFAAVHNSDEIEKMFHVNVIFGSMILESLAKFNHETKFLNLSSYWQKFNGESNCTKTLYATTKNCFDNVLNFYVSAHQHLKVTNLYLYDTYGLNDRRNKVLQQILTAIFNEKKLFFSSGEQLINLTHISDVSSAILQAIESNFGDCQIRSNNFYTLKELVAICEKITQRKLKAVWGFYPDRVSDAYSAWDCAPSLPNWTPIYSLEEGIAEYARNFK